MSVGERVAMQALGKFGFLARGSGEISESMPLLESPRSNLVRNIQDKKLYSITARMYRENAEVSSGSTADAIRHEIKTGELLSPKGHMQKGIEMRAVLNKLIESSKLNRNDESIARWLRRDLQNALSEERVHTQTMRNNYC